MPSLRATLKFVLSGVDDQKFECNKKIKGKTSEEQWNSLNKFIVDELKSRVEYEYSFTISITNIGDDSSSSTVSNAQELHGMLKTHTNLYTQYCLFLIH